MYTLIHQRLMVDGQTSGNLEDNNILQFFTSHRVLAVFIHDLHNLFSLNYRGNFRLELINIELSI